MIRWTTPTITFDIEDTNLSSIEDIIVSLHQKDVLIEKGQNDVTITVDTSGTSPVTTISFDLTEEESAQFSTASGVELQTNWTYYSDGVLKRGGTDIDVISVKRNLHDEGMIE